jgi:hypothetical protein
MDPFVITTLGRKTFRTRVIRHNLNPVYDEKLVFQVLRNETGYSVGFTVVDRDQFSGNDYVGAVNLPLDEVIAAAPVADPETGLYKLPDPHDPASTFRFSKCPFGFKYTSNYFKWRFSEVLACQLSFKNLLLLSITT